MTSYVVDTKKGYCVSQGSYEECERYIQNVRELFYNTNPMVIATGAKERDKIIAECKPYGSLACDG